ncbi:hypothetical protein EUGRSUZ_C01515 [Eucalyptus grandis]|uniref:Uncharacterized protein n=2 Tax=Eucalyptus grandis TaxID=71139 RepID=A0ACC3LCS7_EUCGR|nr:hypothetical protein EUGRSUZ_C01515 [Eucalyptus grandis]
MASCVDITPTEQLCYIPCNFCNIVLAVSVPCSSLLDIVTIRCGHCSNLWSVNMAAAFQSLANWQDAQAPKQDCRMDMGSSSKYNSRITMRAPSTNVTEQRVVNRQRRFRGSRRAIQTLVTGKHSVLLLKTGHTFPIFISD